MIKLFIIMPRNMFARMYSGMEELAKIDYDAYMLVDEGKYIVDFCRIEDGQEITLSSQPIHALKTYGYYRVSLISVYHIEADP